jgi:hypothetical protein
VGLQASWRLLDVSTSDERVKRISHVINGYDVTHPFLENLGRLPGRHRHKAPLQVICLAAACIQPFVSSRARLPIRLSKMGWKPALGSGKRRPITLPRSHPLFCCNMSNDNGVLDEDGWTPAEVRAWARERGIEVGDRGRIPETVIELYLAKPSTIRKWASDRGLQVSERGRISAEIVEQYLARPAAVRSWARRQGIDIGERGRIPVEVIERYLDRFRQLERDAA